MSNHIEKANNLIPKEFLWGKSFLCDNGLSRNFTIGVATGHKLSTSHAQFNGVIVYDEDAREVVLDGHLSTAKGFSVQEQIAFAAGLLRKNWAGFVAACKSTASFNATCEDFSSKTPSTHHLENLSISNRLSSRVFDSSDTLLDGSMVQHFTRGEIAEFLSFHRVSPTDKDSRVFVLSWSADIGQYDLPSHPKAKEEARLYMLELSQSIGGEFCQGEIIMNNEKHPRFRSREDLQRWVASAEKDELRDIYKNVKDLDHQLIPYYLNLELDERLKSGVEPKSSQMSLC